MKTCAIDAVTWVNPHKSTEGGREIDRLSPTSARVAVWERMKERYGIRSEDRGIQGHRRMRRPFVLRQLRRVLAICDNLRCWPTRRLSAT